jgi:hypothetical protein
VKLIFVSSRGLHTMAAIEAIITACIKLYLKTHDVTFD